MFFDLFDGWIVIIEIGKLVIQVDGLVVICVGDMMFFCFVVFVKEVWEGQFFFFFFVDYQEKYVLVGCIFGNFFCWEVKLFDYEVLILCLVDWVICLFFLDGYMNDIQVIINFIFGEQEVLFDVFVALVVFLVLVVFDIFFVGLIFEVCVVCINGCYVVNFFCFDLEDVDLDIIVAVMMDNVMMVEGEVSEVFESVLIEVIKIGYEVIKVQCQVQLEFVEKVGEKVIVKWEFILLVVDDIVKEIVESNICDKIYEVVVGVLDKVVCKEGFKVIIEELMEKLKEEKSEEFMEEYGDEIKGYYDKFKKEVICEMVLMDSCCFDGCKFDEICDIWCEVDYLFFVYGLVVFICGEIQLLIFLILGIKQDELMVDIVMDYSFFNFILYYNFLVFFVGEIKLMCGFGCCEVGYVNLVVWLLKKVMLEEMFYIIWIVFDILEFNGLFFMVIVCVGVLVLMDGGI